VACVVYIPQSDREGSFYSTNYPVDFPAISPSIASKRLVRIVPFLDPALETVRTCGMMELGVEMTEAAWANEKM